MMATLCELSLGEEARVASVQTTVHAHQRLMMMGLLPGTQLRLIHVAPLGDPIAVEFEGQRLCLRRAEAAGVGVQRLSATQALCPSASPRDLTGAALP